MSVLDDIFGSPFGGVTGGASTSARSPLDDIFGSIDDAERKRKEEARRALEQRQAEMRAMGALPSSDVSGETGQRVGEQEPGLFARAVIHPSLSAVGGALNLIGGVDTALGKAAEYVSPLAGPLAPTVDAMAERVKHAGEATQEAGRTGLGVARDIRERSLASGSPSLGGVIGRTLEAGAEDLPAMLAMQVPGARAAMGLSEGLASPAARLVAGSLISGGEGAAINYGAGGSPLEGAAFGMLTHGVLGGRGELQRAAADAEEAAARAAAERAVAARVPPSPEAPPFANMSVTPQEMASAAEVEAASTPPMPTATGGYRSRILSQRELQEQINAYQQSGRAGRPESGSTLPGAGASDLAVGSGGGQGLDRTSPSITTGVGDEVPLPPGSVYRGEASSPDAVAINGGEKPSHLWGPHFTESPTYAALHAEKYGPAGRVVQADNLPLENPFSVARSYSYGELRDTHPEAALQAARDAGVTGADEPIPGQFMQKALIDFFRGSGGDDEALAGAVEQAGRTLQKAGYDGYHHEVFSPGEGTKNAWTVFPKDEAPITEPVAAPEAAQPGAPPPGSPPPSPIAPYAGAVIPDTGIKNAVTASERAARGLPEVEVAARRTFGESFDAGKQAVDSGVLDPRALAQHVIDSPRPLKSEESAALIYDRMRLHNEHANVIDALDRAQANGDVEAAATLRQRQAGIEDAINTNDVAARQVGYEQGHGLAARRMMIRQDYSLANLIQRARVANGGGEVPAPVRTRLEVLSKQLQDALDKSELHDDLLSQKHAQAAVRQMQFAQRTGRRAITRADLHAEFDNLAAQFRAAANTPRMGLDPALVKILGAMAKNRVELGWTDAAQIVDHIHMAVRDAVAGITPRDIRDAISGYGKTSQPSQEELAKALREVKGHMRLTSALEDAEAGQRPLKSGYQHEMPSAKVKEMRRQVTEAMRANGIDPNGPVDPETQMRTALDAVKTRLRHQIEDLDKQIRTGEKAKPRTPVQYDAEAIDLKAQRDRLKETLAAASDDSVMPQARIKAAEEATARSIADLEARIKTGDLEPRRPSLSPWSPKLSELKKQHASLRDQLNVLRDAQKPPVDPEAARLSLLKSRLAKRAEDIQSRLASGDFSPKAKPAPVVLDQDAMNLQAHVAGLKRQMDEAILRQKLAARTLPERAQDFLVKWRRAGLLSNIPTTAKLASAGAQRVILNPLEDAIGALWSHAPGLSKIAEKAPVEGGGFNAAAQVDALSQLFNPETYKDAVQAMKTGAGQLDLLYGKPHPPRPGGLEGALDFFGNVHAALKTPVKRAGFSRALRRYGDWATGQGIDLTNPVEQAKATAYAYKEANRGIFLTDNVITDWYRNGLGYLRGKGHEGAANAMQFLLPIVRVPTNYAAEATSYAGGLLRAGWKTQQVLRRGLENMKPEEADFILRNLKKQTVGAALLTIGYLNADQIGGYYSEGDKRDAGDVKPGGIRFLGVDVPRFLLHTPALEALQIGATIRRAMDAYGESGKPGGLQAGLLRAGAGVASEVPFVDTMQRVSEAISAPESRGRAFIGGMARDTLLPPDVQRLARVMDQEPSPSLGQGVLQQLDVQKPTPVTRHPHSFTDEIKIGVPGLRQQLPTQRGTASRFGMNPWGKPDNSPPTPLDDELKRLSKSIDFPEQRVYDPVSRKRVKLPADEYRTLIQESGAYAQQALSELFADPEYQQATPEEQQNAVDNALGAARQQARLDAFSRRYKTGWGVR